MVDVEDMGETSEEEDVVDRDMKEVEDKSWLMAAVRLVSDDSDSRAKGEYSLDEEWCAVLEKKEEIWDLMYLLGWDHDVEQLAMLHWPSGASIEYNLSWCDLTAAPRIYWWIDSGDEVAKRTGRWSM